MLKRNIGILTYVLIISSVCSAQDKFYAVKKTKSIPVIDGVLNDFCWKDIEEIKDFSLILNEGGLSKEQTVAKILYDNNNLYFGIECKESQIDSMVIKQTKHDSDLWTDDCIEIFINTKYDQNNYYHFISNSVGVKFEQQKQNNILDKSYDGLWTAKTSKGEKSWFLEICIPLESIKVEIHPGDIWGFNVCRERYAGDKSELSCWSDTGDGFHSPSKFGNIVFGSYKDTIIRKLKPEYVSKKKKIISLTKKTIRNLLMNLR